MGHLAAFMPYISYNSIDFFNNTINAAKTDDWVHLFEKNSFLSFQAIILKKRNTKQKSTLSGTHSDGIASCQIRTVTLRLGSTLFRQGDQPVMGAFIIGYCKNYPQLNYV